MHARYEAAWEEYNNIDTAQLKLNDRNEAERCLKFRYSDALKANNAETDALRLAILYQVPTTWQEALVLQYCSSSGHLGHLAASISGVLASSGG